MLIRFVGEIFPPYICTHGPGEDPFEAVMCAVGAASQISYLLIEDSILIQNITWICAGFQNIKFTIKRYNCKKVF